MSKSKEVVESLGIRAGSAGQLLKKGLTEILQDPTQILNNQRRRALIRNAKIHASSIAAPIDQDTAQIEETLGFRFVERELPGGAILYHSRTENVPTIIFPDQTLVTYIPEKGWSKPENGDVPRAYVIQPPIDEHLTRLPVEGFKTAYGELVPFAQREETSWEQHGGLLVDSDEKTLAVLDYDALREKAVDPLSPAETLMEASWYMDSQNQASVCNRPNLRYRKAHNTLGVLIRGDGSTAYFSISNFFLSVENILNEAGIPITRDESVTVRHIAAMSNLVTRKQNAVLWALCGLEYSSGGTYLNELPHGRGHFRMFY